MCSVYSFFLGSFYKASRYSKSVQERTKTKSRPKCAWMNELVTNFCHHVKTLLLLLLLFDTMVNLNVRYLNFDMLCVMSSCLVFYQIGWVICDFFLYTCVHIFTHNVVIIYNKMFFLFLSSQTYTKYILNTLEWNFKTSTQRI